MAEKKWTVQQSNAINARGGTVLVSAAAGSGKTAVLVQRVTDRILDNENPVDADRLLVATFSNAAAGEMKERISAQLMKLSEENPSDMRLKRQILLMDKSHISTIHAFCLELIRDNFHTLGISPDFRIADENELKILTKRCLSDCVEYFYDNDADGGFYDLAELISGGRDDRKLVETIQRLYSFLRSHPFYDDWMEEKLAYYSDDSEIESSVWGRTVFSYANSALSYAENVCRSIKDEIDGDCQLTEKYLPAILADESKVKRCIDVLNGGSWDDLHRELSDLNFVKFGVLRKYEDEIKKQRVANLRDNVKDVLKKLQKLFATSSEQYKSDMKALYPTVKKLFEITSYFANQMDKLKRERRMIDFSDMEHLALQLLIKKENGKYVKTELAEEVSAKFEEVLVDECQDTNETQEMIFKAVSRDESNMFFVGDVKQSIYRFRQAMPELFLEKSDAYAEYDGEIYPAKIALDRNFRSRREITESVNFIFSQIMSREMGEVDYGENESLVAAAEYPESSDCGCEVVFIDSADLQDTSKQEAEASFIAAEIRRLIDSGYKVSDGGVMRPVRYRDIAILMRSPSARSSIYTAALKNAGIPVWTDISTGFSENTEISAVMSLLRAVDNPLLDIPMAAALMSDMFMFSEDEVATVRLFGKGKPLYVCLTQMEKENAADKKILDFLKKFRVFRTLSTVMPADRLIRRIYDMTSFVESVQARPDSQDRRENLFLLTEYAARYEKMGYRGLGGFVRFMDDLAEQEADLAPAVTFSESADVVKIMSIHRSKGLEFPVVFLADTAKQFNKEDLKNTVLLHSSLGFACVVRDMNTMSQYATVPYEATKLKIESGGLSEEMRVLYVALTRAKEKLYITSCSQKPQDRLYKLGASLSCGRKLPAYLVQSATSYMDWIMMCCIRHPDAVGIRGAAGLYEQDILDDNTRWNIRIEKAPELSENEKTEQKDFIAPDKKTTEHLKKRMEYVYPHINATETPSKLGVSQITKRELEDEYRLKREPSFLKDNALSGAQRGQAMHTFLQFADYGRAYTDCAAEVERMASLKYITKRQADAISVRKLESFFSSKLFDRIRRADKLWRELAFVHMVDAEKLGYDAVGESVAVQGVADCVFEENGELVIVDYKTDYVSDISELYDRYAEQVKMYRKLVGITLHKPVKECIIYSLSLSQELKVD